MKSKYGIEEMNAFINQLIVDNRMKSSRREYCNTHISCLDNDDALGIRNYDMQYIRINSNQSFLDEEKRINVFLELILKDMNLEGCSIEFINYGDTELVFVIKKDGKAIKTLLVGQPIVEFGNIKEEYDNLIKLSSRFPKLVVCPDNYYTDGTMEAYQTPYYYQARCIATQFNGYGVYIPDPFYRFEYFNINDEYLVTKAIVANLIRLYDEKEQLGLAACKIGGGDFILEKRYDSLPHTDITTLDNMHLVAARKLVNTSFKDYLKLIREELVKSTYYNYEFERDPDICINHKNRCSMKKEAIEDGITLGLRLR